VSDGFRTVNEDAHQRLVVAMRADKAARSLPVPELLDAAQDLVLIMKQQIELMHCAVAQKLR
jgi:hypothetical protein